MAFKSNKQRRRRARNFVATVAAVASIAVGNARAALNPPRPEEINPPQRKVIKLHLPLHAKQRRAIRSQANEILYGGAAGGGKSHFIRVSLIKWCMEVPGLQCYLFRRLYPDLVKNHMEGPSSFHVLLAPLVNAELVKITSHEIEFLWNGSKIFLNHLQHEKDKNKYHGPEIHVAAFDELTHFTESMYRFIRARLRKPGLVVPAHLRGKFPLIISGTNPGNIGHAWVKKTFVDQGAWTIFQQEKKEGGMLRQFIPARLEDNPTLLESDPDYEDKLEGLGDPALVRAMREGDWSIIAGSAFGDVWRPTMQNRPWHVCEPFPIPSTWEMWRGGDDGYASPAAAYILTRDPDTKTVYVVDEIYGKRMTPVKFSEIIVDRDLTLPVVDWDGADGYNTERLSGNMDSAAFSTEGADDRETSRGDQMNDAGCLWEKVEKWPGSKAARVQNFHRLLKPNPLYPEKVPGVVFFRTCTDAIRTIPMLLRSEKKAEELADNQEDHCFVAGTQVETRIGPVPIEQLRVGDEVWTRAGLKRIVAVQPPRMAETVAVEFSNGARLNGTASHPIWTNERGWIGLYSMTQSDTVHVWRNQLLSPRSGSYSSGKCITSAGDTSRETESDCTSLFGSTRTAGAFRKGITFIMKTRIARIIRATIWSCCSASIISRFTGRPQQTRSGRPEAATLNTRPLGTKRCQSENVAPRVKRDGRTVRQLKSLVRNAARIFQRSDRPSRSSAAENAPSGTCVGVAAKRKTNKKELVFNITVEDQPEYFANGILVHNCFDAITYGLQFKREIFKMVRVSGI